MSRKRAESGGGEPAVTRGAAAMVGEGAEERQSAPELSDKEAARALLDELDALRRAAPISRAAEAAAREEYELRLAELRRALEEGDAAARAAAKRGGAVPVSAGPDVQAERQRRLDELVARGAPRFEPGKRRAWILRVLALLPRVAALRRAAETRAGELAELQARGALSGRAELAELDDARALAHAARELIADDRFVALEGALAELAPDEFARLLGEVESAVAALTAAAGLGVVRTLGGLDVGDALRMLAEVRARLLQARRNGQWAELVELAERFAAGGKGSTEKEEA